MISIVIPALNEERFLPGCLESIRNQDYQGDYEIVLVDNGSTDRTASIARDFGARVIPYTQSRGVFYARQAGADAASGDIIVQADADTVYPKEWLSRIAKKLESHPKAVAVTGRYIYRDRPFWAPFEYYYRHLLNLLTAFLFGKPLIVSGATFAFKRQAFLKVNGYKGLTYSADQYGIAIRLSKVGKVLYDKNIYVMTSSRAVQKPFLVLVSDCFVNIAKWITYLCQDSINALRTATAKSRVRRIAIGSIPLITTFIVLLIGYFIPSSPVFGRVFSKTKPEEKVIALTFDDSPGDPYTPEILGILEHYDVQATFFVNMESDKPYPDCTRQIAAEGKTTNNQQYSGNTKHALGNVSNHSSATGGAATTYEVFNFKPHPNYFPDREPSQSELCKVTEERTVMVARNIVTAAPDPNLWGKPSPIVVANQIIHDAKPGKILILRKSYETNVSQPQPDKALTVQALPIIIEVLKAKGYRFETAPDLLNIASYSN
jgi:glycosyltransferase involved in cell wall biosynthesis/peptidoglycan/xylan/chitin deacetylase (PgdA/CDA1 family)